MATSTPRAGGGRDQVVVLLRGELDIVTAPTVLAVLAAPAIRGQFVRVDLTELDYLDCSTVGSLMHARTVARESGGDLVLANPRGSALRILTILGLAGAPAEIFDCPVSTRTPTLVADPASSVASEQPARHSRPARQSVAASLFSGLPLVRIAAARARRPPAHRVTK